MAINIVYTQTASNDVVPMSFYQGKVVYDATAIVATDYTKITVGFKPKYVLWVNLTDRIQVEWFEGMTASQLLLTVAAGTRTLDTTANAMVVDGQSFSLLQNATLAAILASKTCYYIVKG